MPGRATRRILLTHLHRRKAVKVRFDVVVLDSPSGKTRTTIILGPSQYAGSGIVRFDNETLVILPYGKKNELEFIVESVCRPSLVPNTDPPA
ncbi:hypothetical protein COT78_00630 [Candidatus Berkelbacteria bacterium CG10_big_fil_rev_8_21_14_0_10_43_13]|uniref:Uncharacterized protein n=1 Tax=Candidatus Berkelbacteria bacterium CG10_big_fil_rev_8_21_14_0_10_43_13 TaxID=1974514 RepID=A0A2H0W7B0_9BACT|nr:MAG: hypothetical protein COT78_00630 [Candidatus Berkelbacteria bacterium CG10_big_fil_rev_8_21_14_0_10_43_13]